MPLIILPFVSQVMEPAEFGAASMLTASALLLVTIVAAPLDSLVFRVAARGDEDGPALLRAAGLYCYVVMPCIGALVAAIFAVCVPSLLGVSGYIWGLELLAIGFQPAMAYFALPVVQARQELAKFTAMASIAIILMAATKLGLLLIWQLGVLGWVISDLITAALSAVAATLLVRLPRTKVTRDHLRSVWSFAAPLIPHKASLWAMASMSRPAMALVASLTQVGLLSLGWSVASVANLILSEINRAALPRYSRETFPAPTQQTLSVVRLQVILAFAIPTLVGSTLAIAGQWVFAESYWPAFSVAGVLLIGQAAYGLYLIPTNYQVQTAGMTKPVAFASSAGASLMLVLLLTLGHAHGALGGAYAVAAGILLMLLISACLTRVLRLHIAVRTWAGMWPEVALAASGLTCSVWALMWPVGSMPSKIVGILCLAPTICAVLVSYRRAGVRHKLRKC
ncbi:hypothetical protein MPRF_56650 [Mycolicibacterium parafortuitum]|uniref:Polysaccharide biosynthesis protein n=2 Tax=Mycolicibacterium parafortuitum TaxID=39692 RepID=A0A7I7UF27_MYCPF|nr:hypothetical protein MPRF_56650 [Mycolicibacterium parafortuitum]